MYTLFNCLHVDITIGNDFRFVIFISNKGFRPILMHFEVKNLHKSNVTRIPRLITYSLLSVLID